MIDEQSMCVCVVCVVCVRVRVRVRVRARACACACVCVRACICECMEAVTIIRTADNCLTSPFWPISSISLCLSS